MSSEPINLLLIQDNPAYVGLLRSRLSKEISFSSEVEYAMTLRAGIERLVRGGIDIVLVELSLPDSNGIETYEAVASQDPTIPIVILADLGDEIVALKAVQKGAQDYLLKAEVDGKLLPRIVRHAIERHRMRIELMNLSLTDELTGLCNRRGFFLLAEQQLKVAIRAKRDGLLILADVNGLKQINDTFGHPQGDVALCHTATILKKSFRQSDILARLGGDEFAIFAIEAQRGSADRITLRLKENLKQLHEGKREFPFELSLSFGSSHFNPNRAVLLGQLILDADKSLYQQKKAKQII